MSRAPFAWTLSAYSARYLSLLILIPFYGRVLGPTGYGKLLAGMSLFAVIWIIANWGFSAVGTRVLAESEGSDAVPDELGRQLHGRLMTGSVAIGIGALCTATVPIFREEPLLGLLATCNGVAAAFNLGWFFQGRGRYVEMASLDFVNFGLGLALVLATVREESDASLVLSSLLVANVTALTIAYYRALRGIDATRVKLKGGNLLIRESAPLFAAGGISMSIANASSLILGLYASPAQVGHYGAAERIVMFLLGMTLPVDQVVLPAIARRRGAGDHAGARRIMRRAVAGTIAMGVVIGIGAAILAPVAMPLFFGSQFEPSVIVMQSFAPMFPLLAASHALNTYVLVALHRDRAVLGAVLPGAIVGLVAMVVLAPISGGIGIVMARTFGVAVSLVIAIAVIWRYGGLMEPTRR